MTKRKKFFYSENELEKQKFYYDAATSNNKNGVMHASLQIGTSHGKWSRMPTTTSKIKDKSQYIYLKNPSFNGDKIKLRRQILTSSKKTRHGRATRPKLEQTDISKIKAFINKLINK